MADDLTPELLQALAEYGILDEKQVLAMHQMKQAEALKHTAQPGLTAHGRMLLPASPLEHFANMLKSIQGGQQSASIQQQMADTLRQKAATTAAYKQQEMARRAQLMQAAQVPPTPPNIPPLIKAPPPAQQQATLPWMTGE